MHDMLYEHQRRLDEQAIRDYAGKLRLDVQRFVADLNSETFIGRVMHDFQTGLMSGVNGTPSLFIDGERYDGARDLQSLLEFLQR
jgi:protein-disulfide isomerase